MIFVRAIGLACLVLSFAATFTSFYTEHRHVWLSVGALGLVCSFVSLTRKRA